MPFSLSPSITITEKDLSSIIPQTSNTVACFVGRFNQGPVDEVININSEAKLFEVFGKPDPGEKGVDWWTCANFLNYGDKLKVVRVDEGNGLYYTQGGLTSGSPSQDFVEPYPLNAGRTAAAKVYAKSPGSISNSFRLVMHPATTGKLSDVCSGGETKLPTFGDEADLFSYHPTSTPEVFNSYEAGILTSGATQDEVHYALIDQTGLINQDQPGVTGAVLEKFEGLSMWKGVYDSTGRNLYYKDYINANSEYIKIEENTHRSLIFGNAYLGVSFGDARVNAAIAQSLGFWGQGHEWGSSTGGDPTWTPTTTTMPHPLGSRREFGAGTTYSQGGLDDFVKMKAIRGITASPLVYNAVFAGGADSGITFPYEGVGANSALKASGNPHVAAIRQAYNRHFSDPEFVEIDLILGGAAEAIISKELIEIANTRKDCIAFISPPASPKGTEYNDIAFSSSLGGYSGPDDIIKYRLDNGFNSSYAVMDSGWKYQYDSYNDKFRWIPLNADTAGLVARTEDGSAPFFSPAGLNRGRIAGVVKLAINPAKNERDRLYANSINPVVAFPGEGAVLYGDKTLQRRTTSLDRINVRRLLTTLEKAIATAAKFQLFEFNDEFTRRSFVSTVTPFLRRVQSQRGVTDFRVVCDETNNTGEVISANQFVADIFIKPVQSTNFINLNFSVVRADAVFNESIV